MQGAGARDQRITIQARTDAQDTYGEADPTWATLQVVWAAVRPLDGGEMMGSGLELDAQPHEFEFLYSTDLSSLNTQGHRVTWNSKTFDLVSVQNVNARNREIRAVGVHRG